MPALAGLDATPICGEAIRCRLEEHAVAIGVLDQDPPAGPQQRAQHLQDRAGVRQVDEDEPGIDEIERPLGERQGVQVGVKEGEILQPGRARLPPGGFDESVVAVDADDGGVGRPFGHQSRAQALPAADLQDPPLDREAVAVEKIPEAIQPQARTGRKALRLACGVGKVFALI